MKVQFDLLTYFYGYIAKLIETQLDSIELNKAASKIIEGNFQNYDRVLELSFKMNKNILDIMNSRKSLSIFTNVYKQYAN
ncbi:MAG: hypothetical protein GX756_02630 [Clostridiales bacterium]|nr:hypothetical protein [Clostridiales bacterium]